MDFLWCVTGCMHDVHSKADRYPICYRLCARCSSPSWSVPCLLQVVCTMFIPKLIGTLFVTGCVHNVHPQADRYPVCYRWCAQCSSPSWSVPCLLQVVCTMFIPKLIGTLFVTGGVHNVHPQADRYPVCYRWCARCSSPSWSVPCLSFWWSTSSHSVPSSSSTGRHSVSSATIMTWYVDKK